MVKVIVVFRCFLFPHDAHQAIWQTDEKGLEFQRNIIIRIEGYHDAAAAHRSLSSSAHSGCKKMIFTISISEPCLNEVE